MTGKRGIVDMDVHDSNGLKIQNNGKNELISNQIINDEDEPAKKRQKCENEVTYPIHLSISDYEDEEILDKQIEQEETNADNLVIKDLIGSVKPEPNKVIQPPIVFQSIVFFSRE
jgi:hypothetical protein